MRRVARREASAHLKLEGDRIWPIGTYPARHVNGACCNRSCLSLGVKRVCRLERRTRLPYQPAHASAQVPPVTPGDDWCLNALKYLPYGQHPKMNTQIKNTQILANFEYLIIYRKKKKF